MWKLQLSSCLLPNILSNVTFITHLVTGLYCVYNISTGHGNRKSSVLTSILNCILINGFIVYFRRQSIRNYN